ncbi:hypothetical protein Tco_1307014, partial [Tanacetum coccineum]
VAVVKWQVRGSVLGTDLEVTSVRVAVRCQMALRGSEGVSQSDAVTWQRSVKVSDIDKKDKNKAKTDKTEHGIGKSVKKSRVKSQQVKDEAEQEEI